MAGKQVVINELKVLPVTAERWADLETLFGPNGACCGCWCAWFLMTSREFKESHKEGHKEMLRTLVQSGAEPGLIAYADGVPAGWVALAPRENYKRLAKSTHLGPVDDTPVWVVPCFFIHRDYRHLRLMDALLAGAVDYARAKGVKVLEAFPLEAKEKISSMNLFTGKASVFYAQGFEQVALRDYRPILRKTL